MAIKTAALVARTRELTSRLDPVLSPMIRAARGVAGMVSELGWTVLATAVLAWWLGARFGWVELREVAVAALVLVLACAAFMVGRTRLRVSIRVVPQRIVVGESTSGEVEVVNAGRARLLPVVLEVPVGSWAHRFNLPSLPRGGGFPVLFPVPTDRRGVLAVGPATTVRGDPLGLLRRTVPWTGVIEVFVHPVSVALGTFSTGLLRDLEGQPTNDVSMSDLAFHALREYAPGDDRRYIHWRSSAKMIASGREGSFLVRQFLDTRRSHVCICVDSEPATYLQPEDFEVAVSAAASIVRRTYLDEMPCTVAVSQQLSHERPAVVTLDALSRAEVDGTELSVLAARAARAAVDASVAVLITGAAAPFAAVTRASLHFPPEVGTVVIRIDPGAQPSMSANGPLTVLTLGALQDLPAMLGGAAAR